MDGRGGGAAGGINDAEVDELDRFYKDSQARLAARSTNRPRPRMDVGQVNPQALGQVMSPTSDSLTYEARRFGTEVARDSTNTVNRFGYGGHAIGGGGGGKGGGGGGNDIASGTPDMSQLRLLKKKSKTEKDHGVDYSVDHLTARLEKVRKQTGTDRQTVFPARPERVLQLRHYSFALMLNVLNALKTTL